LNLLSQITIGGKKWTMTVVDTSGKDLVSILLKKNAFVLPSGDIYVTSRLLDFLNDDQVSSVYYY
jgi:Zn-dependent protease with chaperone function